MPDPITAITAGSAVIGAGSSIFGASSASKAAEDAAKAQKKATQQAIAANKKALERQLALEAPFRQVGLNALTQFPEASAYTPFGMAQFEADPGYQFRMSEGVKALDRSAAARGLLQSGPQIKGVTRFGQDLASQEYQNAFGRYLTERQAKLAPLQYMIGIGQNATGQQGGYIGNTAQQNSALLQAIGNIQGQAAMTQGNIMSNLGSNIGSIANNALGNYMGYTTQKPISDYYAGLAANRSVY